MTEANFKLRSLNCLIYDAKNNEINMSYAYKFIIRIFFVSNLSS